LPWAFQHEDHCSTSELEAQDSKPRTAADSLCFLQLLLVELERSVEPSRLPLEYAYCNTASAKAWCIGPTNCPESHTRRRAFPLPDRTSEVKAFRFISYLLTAKAWPSKDENSEK